VQLPTNSQTFLLYYTIFFAYIYYLLIVILLYYISSANLNNALFNAASLAQIDVSDEAENSDIVTIPVTLLEAVYFHLNLRKIYYDYGIGEERCAMHLFSLFSLLLFSTLYREEKNERRMFNLLLLINCLLNNSQTVASYPDIYVDYNVSLGVFLFLFFCF
jgi:hypothetical protein